MAISLRSAGTWETASSNATSYQFTIPTHQANDCLLLRCFIKPSNGTTPATISPSIDQDWTIIANGYDYTNASGNGTGSLYALVAWKKATSASETGPTVTFGTSTSPAEGVITVFQRGTGETWVTPVAVIKGYTTTTSISVTMDSNPGVTAGDMCVSGIGHADNDTLTSPTFTQSGVTFATVVECPATANSSATGNDIAGDGAYRLASSGTATAAPVVTGTASSSMEGMVSFTRLRVTVATEPDAGSAAATAAAYNASVTVGPAAGAAAATAEAEFGSAAAAAFGQSLGANGNGTAAQTSTVLSPSSKTVTVDNTIVVGWGGYYDITPSGVTDNLGNTYTRIGRRRHTTGGATVDLWSAPVTTGGSITTITVAHASTQYVWIIAAEIEGVLGSPSLDSGAEGLSSSDATAEWSVSATIPANGIIVGVVDSSNTVTHTAGAASGSPSTSITIGQVWSGDISGSLAYAPPSGGAEVTSFTGSTNVTASGGYWVGVAGIFNPSSTGVAGAIANVGPVAVIADATATAYDPPFASSTNANAGIASATAAAHAPGQSASVGAGVAATSAAGLAAIANVGPVAETAAGTAAAYQPTLTIASNASAGAAAAAAAAYQPTLTLASNASAGIASATAAAHQPTLTLASNATAGAAAVTATAYQPTVTLASSPSAGLADVVAAAYDATVSTASQTNVEAGLAAATAEALAPTLTLASNANAGQADTAAVAYDATVTASGNTYANAGLADAAAAALTPTASLAPNDGLAAGTATGYDATASTASTTYANAAVAEASAAAYQPTLTLASNATAGLAAVTADAHNATTTGTSNVYVNAGLAEVGASALPTVFALMPNGGLATVTGEALVGSTSIAPHAGSGAATAAAYGILASSSSNILVFADLAAAMAAAVAVRPGSTGGLPPSAAASRATPRGDASHLVPVGAASHPTPEA